RCRHHSRGHPQCARRAPHGTDHPAHRQGPFMNEQPATTRHIPDRLGSPLRAALFSWPALLFVVAISLFVLNSVLSPYFLSPWSLSDATYNFTEKALIALAMALLIISGE